MLLNILLHYFWNIHHFQTNNLKKSAHIWWKLLIQMLVEYRDCIYNQIFLWTQFLFYLGSQIGFENNGIGKKHVSYEAIMVGNGITNYYWNSFEILKRWNLCLRWVASLRVLLVIFCVVFTELGIYLVIVTKMVFIYILIYLEYIVIIAKHYSIKF